MTWFFAGSIGLAFILAFVLTPLVIKLAPHIGGLDRPNQRKVHKKILPRIGGVAIYLAFTGTILLTQLIPGQPIQGDLLGLLVGGAIIFALGLADDLWNLPPRIKLLGQIIAAVFLIIFGVKADFATNPFTGGVFSLGYLSIPITILWVVGITNAVNLIDGLDGLAAGVSAIAAITLAVVGWQTGDFEVAVWALILVASILGFLRYNFNPAKIFMGDSGAMFLGFSLAGLSLMGLAKSTTAFSLVIPFVILGIPILDTLCAIVRRFIGGQPIFQADKEHLHHRLLELGLTHKGTVVIIYGVSMTFSLSAIALTYFARPGAIIVLLLLTGLVIFGVRKLGVLGNIAQYRNRKTDRKEGYREISQ